MARHGQPERASDYPDDSSKSEEKPDSTSPSAPHSSDTRVDTRLRATNTVGQKLDREKGCDVNIVDWIGGDDPENPMNWSLPKKVFVTGEVCLLTTSVYIDSVIYRAGIGTVVLDFGVSQIAATLGLTLFVAGYGLGPMIWAPMYAPFR